MALKGTDYLFVALGIGALYVLWKGANVVSDAAASAAALPGAIGESIGGALFDWTHPYDPKSDTFYSTTFPDGSRYGVQASTVAADGTFTREGNLYVMKTDAAGHHVALAVTQ